MVMDRKKGEAGGKDDEKVCSGDIHHHVKIFLHCVCCHAAAAVHHWFHLCDSEVKGCCRIKKYRPSNPPSDSVYEEMRRSTLDGQPSVRTLINPDYQSIMLLH
ncbi:hypothetical protein cypCar_00038864 [Cyprinus carpio]|nr:hypothetical protein cypCar_00038864 [Cyprinus carpio]